MIARIWHGKTALSKYAEYTNFLVKTAVPDYRSVAGNVGVSFLRRSDNFFGYFTLITYWDSVDSTVRFAGEDYLKAKYYPEDNDFLLSFEEHVEHFDVFYHQSL